MHVVHTPHSRVLLDCGLFQGRRSEAFEKNSHLPFRAEDIDVCVLSHAHIDHSGSLPMLYKSGYRGPIHATPATRDLCAAMLEDAAMIQAHDAQYLNKRIEREHLDEERIEPLYDMEDVLGTLSSMFGTPYRRRTTIAPGVDLTFLDAGHVLGSAIVVLDIDDMGEPTRIVFTGDLGRSHMPILRDPEIPSGAHMLISESTYGDRLHDPMSGWTTAWPTCSSAPSARRQGGDPLVRARARPGDRLRIEEAEEAGRMPPMPVFVDSPLTVRVTDVFKTHPDCYDANARAMLAGGESPFEFPGLTYTQSVEDSKAIDASSEPSIIISASGMCESGRILHHLKSTIGGPENTVVIVGFQAQHTLGRRLVEGRTRVRIFGVERERRAEVVVLNGFSAHADQADLIRFAEAVREQGPLRRVALVHGEPKSQEVLAALLTEREFTEVRVPEQGERIRV